VRGLESLNYAKNTRIIEMNKSDISEHNIEAFKINFEEGIEQYKRKAVREIIKHHPPFYKDIIEFHDWDSAMIYLNTEGLQYIQQFLKDK